MPLDRPYVCLSTAATVDGYIDDTGDRTLVISNVTDLRRADGLRASCDAVMIGAGTLRRDNPSLLVRSPELVAARVAAGLSEQPAKVVLTASGQVDVNGRFFTEGDNVKLVYCPSDKEQLVAAKIGAAARSFGAGNPLDLQYVLGSLRRQGVERLLVEGGGHLQTQLLVNGLVDEIQLAIAPFFLGNPAAPRFARAGTYPQNSLRPMRLAEVLQIDDMAVLRYVILSPGHPDSGEARGRRGDIQAATSLQPPPVTQ